MPTAKVTAIAIAEVIRVVTFEAITTDSVAAVDARLLRLSVLY